MIEFKKGNLLTEDTEAIVNTVNCVGVMGRGIALQFKKTFPDNFKIYETACKSGNVKPGEMFVYETHTLSNPKYIINFPTKRHWKGASNINDIEKGLIDLVRVINKYEIKSISIPPLGCGLGGLKWADVKPLIERIMSKSENIRIHVYEPQSVYAENNKFTNKKIPKMTPGRAALIELMSRYLNGLLDPYITLLEVHKLMYFMQEAGEELRLKFQKAQYGPYAENLRHVLNDIEGYYISGYLDGGDYPDKQLSLIPGATDEASRFLSFNKETNIRFDKVISLIDGFESSFGLELLATVHWIIKHNKLNNEKEIIHYIYNWNSSKKKFTPNQISIAINVLNEKKWLNNQSITFI